jgi:hypothetical protein
MARMWRQVMQEMMHKMERRLHARDIDQRTRHPFEWGLDHLDQVERGSDGSHPREVIRELNRVVLADSDRFFRAAPADGQLFRLDRAPSGKDGRRNGGSEGGHLRYPSGVVTPYPENNTVHGRYYPAGNGRRAVIISPQWNADAQSHLALCHLLNRCGVSALRLSLPYHDWRRPPELRRADYMISANIGRTIQAVRQAVVDIRRAADWLEAQGYEQLGVMGSSIGSCVSWLAFIHDPRLAVGVFNMVSSWFGDVVWRAITTSHIRAELESHLTADEVREVWRSISPSGHLHRLPAVRRPALLISASYDLTFLPDLTEIFIADVLGHGVPAETRFLPCGHYTIGRTPFKYLDAWHIVNFFRRQWSLD